MEAFEHIAKIFLESEGYAVSTNVKFPVRIRTRKQAYEEHQVHGYEIDLVACRADTLLLGSVKSFLGSYGVDRQFFHAIADPSKKLKGDKFFNDPAIAEGILSDASARFGYPRARIFSALFVGKFRPGHEADIRRHLESTVVGAGPIRLFDLSTIMDGVIIEAQKKTYRDDPVIVAVKSLLALDRVKGIHSEFPIEEDED